MLQSHSIELSHEPRYYERGLRVPPVAQERILQAVAVLDVHDLARVWDWPVVAARCD
jgi:hypothetical protein